MKKRLIQLAIAAVAFLPLFLGWNYFYTPEPLMFQGFVKTAHSNPKSWWQAHLPKQFSDFKTTLKAARAGDADAQFLIGAAYESECRGNWPFFLKVFHAWFGLRNASWKKQAAKWLTLAATQKHLLAETMLSTSLHVPAEQRIAYLKHAAENGVPSAQHNYGWHLARGIDISEDLIEAYKWFYLAQLTENESYTLEEMDRVREKMSPPQIKEAEKRADEFLKRRRTSVN